MEVYTVAQAKNKFPLIRRKAARGIESIVMDFKRTETGAVSVISTDLLNRVTTEALSGLTYQWVDRPGDSITDTEENQTWNLWNEQLRLHGVGLTKEEAVYSLVEDAMNYAEEYFDDLEYFLNPKSERDGHYWILRGIKQCQGNKEKVLEVMGLKKLLEE